ncbi:hypothetical protein NE473_32195, partial [Hungatella sp. SL.1.14]|nr:hypothetical protein [Hungatella sp. SL.1.14]
MMTMISGGRYGRNNSLVLWMISGSLKNNTEILNGGMNLIPPAWRVENFANGWKGFGGISFISLDGGPKQHDYYRKTPAGKGSFTRIMENIEMLK